MEICMNKLHDGIFSLLPTGTSTNYVIPFSSLYFTVICSLFFTFMFSNTGICRNTVLEMYFETMKVDTETQNGI